VRLAGICATDLELVKGYYPFRGVLGHEFVGEVVQAPEKGELIGKRVVGEINIACGHCQACIQGLPTHCENRSVLGIVKWNGAFAQYLVLPVKNLYTVLETTPDEVAVFTEPLAAALEIPEQVKIRPSSRVLLIGAGRLGQLIAQTLRLTGCDFTVVTRYEKQRAHLSKLHIPVNSAEDVLDKSMDIVVDASGNKKGFALACRAVRPRGTLILKSTYMGETQVNLSRLVVDEVTLIGSRCGPFAPALRLLEKGLVDPIPLIDASYPLTNGLAAFNHAARPGVFKVLLRPSAGADKI
jgi:threonine dehydrogenase-like Zn-dependent dehydrogenase